MKHAKQEIKQATSGTGKFVEEKLGADFEKIGAGGAKKGSSIKDILGVSDDSAEAIYGQAYLLYTTGKYRDAAEIFKLLIMMNSIESKYVMGLAACYHMLKEYQSAASTYMLVSAVDGQNPLPYFHASDCYIQMGDKVSAALMLEMTLKKVGDNKKFETLKQRATITLAGLKQELLKRGES